MKYQPLPTRYRFRRPGRRPVAFTLTELLISIAIALILILGINQIFKASSFTASAGQALSAANRDNIVIKTALAEDINNFAADGVLVIRCEQRYAYRNAADKQADTHVPPDPEYVAVPNSSGFRRVLQTVANDRSHRLDRLLFFARSKYVRQTSPRNPPAPMLLTSPDTSNEAMIWYGHLALPNNAWVNNQGGDFYNPASTAGGNDNNSFASDWVLGRVATLLRQATAGAQAMDYLGGPPAVPATALDPLIYSSKTGDGYPLYNAPSDVANVPGGISAYVAANINASSFTGRRDWFDPMIGFDPLRVTSDPTNRKGEYWHTGSPFLASPQKAGAARVTPVSASYLSFCMSRGCAQFIVEFAGDYLTQDDNPASPTYGQVTQPADGAVHPDGKIDFFIDPATGEHRIRWYGYPRWMGPAVVDRNGNLNIDSGGNPIVGLRDVLPLWELMPGKATAPFERWGIGYYSSLGRPTVDPYSPSYNYTDSWAPASEPLATIPPAYVCAWSPDMANMLPKMLRITIAIDDPNGRLAGPQFYEYVFNLPQ